MMAFIGVRISWLMLARNRLLASVAASALRRASSTSEDLALMAALAWSSSSFCSNNSSR